MSTCPEVQALQPKGDRVSPGHTAHATHNNKEQEWLVDVARQATGHASAPPPQSKDHDEDPLKRTR